MGAIKPLGLLGGTFDPVHKAHLALAHAAMDELGLAGVRWIPSGQPGHRDAPRATAKQRLAMLELALRDAAHFSLDPLDARASAPTYTINTLQRLRQELGADIPLVFLIGADQLAALDTWREWRRLLELTHFAVAERPGYPIRPEQLAPALAEELAQRSPVAKEWQAQAAGGMLRFAMPPMDVSASAIRATLAAGKTPAELLPAAVLDYIQSHHLYEG